ncbi:MAG: AMP-binding protein [Planctomycetes bacterium]|nr:AMP-binding protein [Planctomycetota bacterium]
MLHEGELGVHPPGALGVAFFIHASAECFIGRGGDGITQPLKDAGTLHLDASCRFRSVALRGRIFANLLEADAQDRMPEVLLVCCNPDQLGLFTAELTRYLENLSGRGRLATVEHVRREMPILLILPNGILAEQTLATFTEQLQESVLMKRLPGVDEAMQAAIFDRVVRGVSLQAGGRRGAGADTVYLLERKGLIVFAGGGETARERIETVLTAHDYPFQHARGVPGTRIEFDKAMISIVLNVGGLIHTVKADGELIDLRMGDLCKDPTKADFVGEITRAVFDVGQAAGAYPPEARYEDIWAGHRATILAHSGHVTSSLKSFRDALDAGLASIQLFSNEEWILTPLARYAGNAGLHQEQALFHALKRRVKESMARAIHRRAQGADGAGGKRTMKLNAQRNFAIELYEADSDKLVLIGTMLDNEHLIKLELEIFLPDEQITRSKLDMVRIPFPVCREVATLADRLVGLRIERGVINEITRRIGGHLGCSHIKELASNMVYFAASTLVGHRLGMDPNDPAFANRPPDERFELTKQLLSDSCLAYCQSTAWGLDERIGIKKIGEEYTHPIPLGEHEPSLGAVLKDRAARWADRPYLRFWKDGRPESLTFGAFAARVWQIARHLIEQGLNRGDRVVVVSENRPEMYLAEMAAMTVGAVSVPVYAAASGQTIGFILERTRPRCVVVSGAHQLTKIERARHPWIEKFHAMDFDAACRSWGAADFAELTTGGGVPEARLESHVAAVLADDLCVMPYTSGTTGTPKGVRLCHRHLISQQKGISLVWDLTENDVFMNHLPWHHAFGGLFERYMTLYHGAELCLADADARDVERLLENWRVFDPSVFFAVPWTHDRIVQRAREDRAVERIVFGGRLRFAFSAGALLPARVEAEYRRHSIPVVEGYGLTEAGPCVAVTTTDSRWRSQHVGFPLPGVKLRINSEQEILVKGVNVMEGYFDAEEETAHVITDDGWLRTGDLGEYTKEGLRLFGRKDGTFKLTTGMRVHPMRVETALVTESRYIRHVVVQGSGQDFVGALIYPDIEALTAWARDHGVDEANLVASPAVRELFAAELERINPMIEVKHQRVRRAVLADRPPSVGNGELTPLGKLVQPAVVNNYRKRIDALFLPEPPPEVIQVKPTYEEADLGVV